MRLSVLMASLLSLAGAAATLHAQQTHVGTPLQTAGHSFQENIGSRWGVQGNGWFFNFGGPAPQANLGGGFGGGGFQGGWRLTAQQGSNTSLGSASPSVTVMNGGMGYFSDTVQRPFVTGLIPVVGNMPSAPSLPLIGGNAVNPVHERLARLEAEGPLAARPKPATVAPIARAGAATGPSSADRGDLGVAAIRAQQAAETSAKEEEIAGYLAKARSFEAAGKPGLARIYYQMARQAKP